ncbi:hypothetical protein ACFLX5_06030, partial [Chloroflexota bacterium]
MTFTLLGTITREPVATFPTGLRNCWAEFREQYKCTLSKIQAATGSHGLSIIMDNPKVKEIMKLYSKKVQEAKVEHDKNAMKFLEEKAGPLSFTHAVKFSTSVGVLQSIIGVRSKWGFALGLPDPKLNIYACIESILTLDDKDWDHYFSEESRLFLQYAD